MKKTAFLLFLLTSLACVNAQNLTVGTKIEIKYNATWYPGSIVATNGSQYKVHYDGYGSSSDEWVGTDRLRIKESKLGAYDPSVRYSLNSAVEVEVRGVIYRGKVVEMKNDTYKIRFDGYSDYWDEWVTAEAMRPLGTGSKVIVSTSTAAKGKLYLRQMYVIATGATELKWFFLSDDGTIVLDPKNGVNPVNMVLEKQNNFKNMGRYQLRGNTLSVQWLNGQTTNWGIEQKSGILTLVDAGGHMQYQRGLPSGYRLHGSFSGGAGTSGVRVGRTYTFRQDGTFSMEQGGYTAGGGTSQSRSSGRYGITGNTILFVYADGKKEIAPIAVWSKASTISHVIIHSMAYAAVK